MPPIPFHLGGNSMTSQLAFFAQTINFSLPPNLPSRASTDPKERDGRTSVTQHYDLRALISGGGSAKKEMAIKPSPVVKTRLINNFKSLSVNNGILIIM